MGKNVEISDLVGKTIVKILGTNYDPSYSDGLNTKSRVANGDDQIHFQTSDGSVYKFYHEQDCCEGVSVEDVCGDLDDLIGTPIIKAEKVTSEDVPEVSCGRDDYDMWTFYHFATIKGYMTIRWHGSSNGYYSVGVDIEKDLLPTQ